MKILYKFLLRDLFLQVIILYREGWHLTIGWMRKIMPILSSNIFMASKILDSALNPLVMKKNLWSVLKPEIISIYKSIPSKNFLFFKRSRMEDYTKNKSYSDKIDDFFDIYNLNIII